MKHKNKIMNTSLMLVALSLTACVSTEEQRDKYLQLSCYALAKEIGNQEAIIERAQTDGVVADIESIFTKDKKKKEEADVDSLFADLDQDTAQDTLNMLKEIEYKKNCSNK